MEKNIKREYPVKKNIKLYMDRYTYKDFQKYEKIKNDVEENKKYEKWKLGINFKTNRKIKIGGPTHTQISYENYYFLFNKLDGINRTLYLQETEDIKKNIENYNKKIDDIICKINSLQDWNEFIEFENEKYGIPLIYKNIHREKNCFGIFENYIEDCTCSTCENYNGCGYYKEYYKCKKCQYTFLQMKYDKITTLLGLIN